jgi:uncharacterized membrane protein YphA (DoxX/SURF4 family)
MLRSQISLALRLHLMHNFSDTFDKIDKSITSWMSKYGLLLLRLSVGIVFFWFGILKFFPGLSPAQDLAIRTIDLLSFGLVPAQASIHILAAWEVLIGLGLLTGIYLRATLFLLFLQMAGTISPAFFFPAEVFTKAPYAPTLEGQYIIKNLVIVSAGIVLGATVRKQHPKIA